MSADTERFSSRFKRENRTSSATSRLRKQFDNDGNNDRETTSRASSGVSVSVGGRFNRDRNEPAAGTKTESISDRMNKLKLKDKNDKESAVNDVSSDKEDHQKDEEDEDNQPSKSRTQRKEKGVGHADKRKKRRNIREKRRSTGVVIMPGVPVN